MKDEKTENFGIIEKKIIYAKFVLLKTINKLYYLPTGCLIFSGRNEPNPNMGTKHNGTSEYSVDCRRI